MKQDLFLVRQSQCFFQLQSRHDDRVAAAGIIAADFVSDVPVQGGDVAALRQSAAVGGVHHQQHAGWICCGRVEMEKIGFVDLRERGEAGTSRLCRAVAAALGSMSEQKILCAPAGARCLISFQFILQVLEAGGAEAGPALEGERTVAVDRAPGKDSCRLQGERA